MNGPCPPFSCPCRHAQTSGPAMQGAGSLAQSGIDQIKLASAGKDEGPKRCQPLIGILVKRSSITSTFCAFYRRGKWWHKHHSPHVHAIHRTYGHTYKSHIHLLSTFKLHLPVAPMVARGGKSWAGCVAHTAFLWLYIKTSLTAAVLIGGGVEETS